MPRTRQSKHLLDENYGEEPKEERISGPKRRRDLVGVKQGPSSWVASLIEVSPWSPPQGASPLATTAWHFPAFRAHLVVSIPQPRAGRSLVVPTRRGFCWPDVEGPDSPTHAAPRRRAGKGAASGCLVARASRPRSRSTARGTASRTLRRTCGLALPRQGHDDRLMVSASWTSLYPHEPLGEGVSDHGFERCPNRACLPVRRPR